jgi:hypothetical protein
MFIQQLWSIGSLILLIKTVGIIRIESLTKKLCKLYGITCLLRSVLLNGPTELVLC